MILKILTWEARQEKNLTLIKLASLTGISKATLNYIENNKRPPKLQQLEKIASVLDVRITDLFESKYK